MKQLILSFLIASVLLLAACTFSAPTVTQTIFVTHTLVPDSTQTVVFTVTNTSTSTVMTTHTITSTVSGTITPPTTTTTTPPTTTTTTTTTPGQETYNITGTWSGEWWRSDGKEEGTLIATLIQSGSSLSGDMTFTSTTFEYSQDTTVSGTVEGSEVVFGMAISSSGETITIDYEGTISEDGNRMSGTYYISTGWTGTWDVTRQ
jgi:hypothetical protein